MHEFTRPFVAKVRRNTPLFYDLIQGGHFRPGPIHIALREPGAAGSLALKGATPWTVRIDYAERADYGRVVEVVGEVHYRSWWRRAAPAGPLELEL